MSAQTIVPPKSLPLGPRDLKVRLPPGRSSRLPVIYRTANHPLHTSDGFAYFFIQNGSSEGMMEAYRYEDEQAEFPQGREEEAIEKGFLRLCSGDIIFQRMMGASSTGVDDVAVLWVCGSEILSSDLVRRATALRDLILGDRALRTREAPDRSNILPLGGTHFERVFPAKQNLKNGRCYGFGTSFEVPSRIFAPSAQGRLDVADPDTLSMRRRLLSISTEIAMLSLRMGPSEIHDNLKLNGELFNLPTVGSDDNYAFTSYQLNLAPVRDYNSNETLGDAMGMAGDAHIDEHDAAAHFTAVTILSDLPARFDPGRFFLAYPGVYVQLDYLSTVVFAGTRVHGSSPPIATADSSDEELTWATRCATVAYGGTGPTEGFQKRPIGVAGFSNGGSKKGSKKPILFNITPEMLAINPSVDPAEYPKASHSTFVREGPTIMSRGSLVTFLCRSILSFVFYLLSQLPPEYDIRVDSDRLLSAFSYQSDDGQRVNVGPWEAGPGWRSGSGPASSSSSGAAARSAPSSSGNAPSADIAVSGPLISQRDSISSLTSQWRSYYRKYSGHIPFAVSYLKDVMPLEGWNGGRKPPKLDGVHPNKTTPNTPENPPAPQGGTGSSNAAAGPSGVPGPDPIAVPVRSTRWDAEVWTGLDKQVLDHVMDDVRMGTAEYPMDVEGSDGSSSGSSMDIDAQTITHADLPSYLRPITSAAVHAELVQVQNCLLAFQSATTFVDRASTTRILRSFHTAISERPLALESFALIQDSWSGLDSLIRDESEDVFRIRKQRASIMMTNFVAWNWLKVSIPRAVKSVRQSETDFVEPWLDRLVTRALEYLKDSSSHAAFTSSEYGIVLPEDVTATLDLSDHVLSEDDNVLTDQVVSMVQDILAVWLRYPTTGNAVFQAQFVGSVIDAVGYEALVLDCVWTKYQMATRFYFRGGTQLPIVNSVTIGRYPLLNPRSDLRKAITTVFSIVDEVSRGYVSNGSVAGEHLRLVLNQRTDIFRRYLNDCYACWVGRSHISNTTLQSHLLSSPDFYLPFRELAPSRVRAREEGGPFDPVNLRTLEGAFGGLIDRGVLFNSEYSRSSKCRLMFRSPEDFRQAVVNMPVRSYCNPSAYGTKANSKRKPELVDEFWAQLHRNPWPAIGTDRKLGFMECFHYFKPTRGSRFPELGPLGAYLLTVDYVYAGAVEYPTLEEMGRLIHFINKGPVAALELLGLLPPRAKGQGGNRMKASEAACIEAFGKAHAIVSSSLSAEQSAIAGIDFFVTEHALCKFFRSKSFLGL